MDVDLESVEIIFAQKLTCGEPPVRARALRELQKWIERQSKENQFGTEDLMRLCKGLHYAMWMQDKMILHEELADRIASLLHSFSSEEERARFVECALASLSLEWPAIDKWRMDKFLMFIRRIIRVAFHHLAADGWKEEMTEKYFNGFKSTAISTDRSFSEALKYHFASLFLDELDLAGNLDPARITELLRPFAEVLALKATSGYLFDSIMNEIFVTILHSVSEEIAEEDETMPEEGEPAKKGITFDYASIGRMLFELGKQPNIVKARRQRFYDIAKKFEIAAKGADPLALPKLEKPKEISTRQLNNATAKLASMDTKLAKDTERARKMRKQRSKESVLPDIAPALSSATPSGKKFKGKGEEKKVKGKKITGKKVTGKKSKQATAAKRKDKKSGGGGGGSTPKIRKSSGGVSKKRKPKAK